MDGIARKHASARTELEMPLWTVQTCKHEWEFLFQHLSEVLPLTSYMGRQSYKLMINVVE